ncbi:MAG: PIN domain-containing protein [Campylobacterales bacterium]|nr:PIN domain-containing protein [Campylobacterales bacterium]
METIYLDTHVVVWLFVKEVEKLSPKAIEHIENSNIIISPMVVLELEFLYEIKRITYQANEIITSLAQSIDLKVSEKPFHQIIHESLTQNWTRDPFDRIIVSHAKSENALLLSRDTKILEHYNRAVW